MKKWAPLLTPLPLSYPVTIPSCIYLSYFAYYDSEKCDMGVYKKVFDEMLNCSSVLVLFNVTVKNEPADSSSIIRCIISFRIT